MKASLIFVRDRRFYSPPSSKFSKRREKTPYPQGKRHYVFGEPPLGIMYLSSVLKRAGHEVTLTDQCHPEYSDDGFLHSLRRERPDLVGISFLSNMCYPAARELSGKIKTNLPAAKIVWGGVFSTINARRIVATETSIDAVACGEGEDTLRELSMGLHRIHDIPGLTFRTDRGKVVETPKRENLPALDAIPFPDRGGLDINYVASLPLDVPAVIWDRPYTSIVSSRGCPFACTYCNCPTFSGRRCRVRSAENVLEEIQEIEQQGYRAFSFLDDNFLLDPERVSKICDGMLARRHKFRWACEGRADPKVNGVFDKLAAAGCDMVMFGIESGSQRILDSMNKRTRLNEIEQAVACARKAGIRIVHGFFIVGSPDETEDEVKQTFTFAERLGINSFNFNSLTAFRGTSLWTDAVDKGLIDEEKDWDKMFPVHTLYPDAMDSQALFRLRARSVRRLIRRKILRHPWEGATVLLRFLRCMSARDLFRLLTSSRKDHTSERL